MLALGSLAVVYGIMLRSNYNSDKRDLDEGAENS